MEKESEVKKDDLKGIEVYKLENFFIVGSEPANAFFKIIDDPKNNYFQKLTKTKFSGLKAKGEMKPHPMFSEGIKTEIEQKIFNTVAFKFGKRRIVNNVIVEKMSVKPTSNGTTGNQVFPEIVPGEKVEEKVVSSPAVNGEAATNGEVATKSSTFEFAMPRKVNNSTLNIPKESIENFTVPDKNRGVVFVRCAHNVVFTTSVILEDRAYHEISNEEFDARMNGFDAQKFLFTKEEGFEMLEDKILKIIKEIITGIKRPVPVREVTPRPEKRERDFAEVKQPKQIKVRFYLKLRDDSEHHVLASKSFIVPENRDFIDVSLNIDHEFLEPLYLKISETAKEAVKEEFERIKNSESKLGGFFKKLLSKINLR